MLQDRGRGRASTALSPTAAAAGRLGDVFFRSQPNRRGGVDAGERVIAVFADGNTDIWKGKIFHDLLLVHVGDDFAGRCRADASGRLVADLIELNVVNFFGIITRVGGGGDSFDMFTNPKADPQ